MTRILGLLIWLATSLVAVAGVDIGAKSPTIDVLTVKGVINPVVASYIGRGIGLAESQGDVAVVIQLDTPGGLDSSMRDIVQRMLNSSVPVIVYVSPAGARSASAGVFITMAGHVAAMAPNTNIGAAHPVAIGSTGGVTEVPSTMEEKVLNDAVAYIKSIAEERGRNAEWAERAVRESVSITEQEALRLNVIDLVAPDLPALLHNLHGHQVTMLGGRQVTLETEGAGVRFLNMGTIERFLLAISDPNIAYILLSLAMLGIFFELANPGAIFPGVIGGISLFLALYSLGMLPVNIAGVLLIALAFVLFLLEIFVTSHGMLAIGGITSLTIGSLILFSGRSPLYRVDPWLIGVVVTIVTGFFVFVVAAVVRAQKRRAVTGSEGMLGMVAVARTPLDPTGTVFLQGETWSATAEGEPVEPGQEVIVTRVEGLKLWVTRKK
ncbi:MAG: nodulation protein NfeD [Chloroflexi bacterium]|nr:nodulation protein NfeD [Chloroflexota bacterium]